MIFSLEHNLINQLCLLGMEKNCDTNQTPEDWSYPPLWAVTLLQSQHIDTTIKGKIQPFWMLYNFCAYRSDVLSILRVMSCFHVYLSLLPFKQAEIHPTSYHTDYAVFLPVWTAICLYTCCRYTCCRYTCCLYTCCLYTCLTEACFVLLHDKLLLQQILMFAGNGAKNHLRDGLQNIMQTAERDRVQPIRKQSKKKHWKSCGSAAQSCIEPDGDKPIKEALHNEVRALS